MDDNLVKYLEKLSLFKGTPQHVLNKIAGHAQTLTLSKGQQLIRQGDPSDALYIIRRGWFKVVAQGEAGQEIILNQVGPGQIIGEMSLIDQQSRSGSVIALSPAQVLEIKYYVVLDVLDQHPALVQSFLRDMSERIRFANAYIGEAIEWCQHISDGNYDFVKKQVEQSQATIVDLSKSHQVRAGAFLSVFFKMVKGVMQREANLKQQIHQLTIEIDEVKRQKDVSEITDTQFFEELQASAKKMREKRQAQLKKRSRK